jgi:preprotein translocase subunit SecG
MKKLFAVLLTLCLVFSLPLFVMAEETTTAPETVEETTTAPETVEETAPIETESAPENETEAETEYQMNLGFYPETLLDTLPVMGMGMLGIFLVTCVIVLAVVVLSKIGKEKEED